MFMQGDVDWILMLGLAAAAGLGLSVLGFYLAFRAFAAYRTAAAEREQAERAAMHGEKRLNSVLHSIPVALVETDLSGRFTFANRAAHQLLGRRDSELIGLRFHSATWGITYPDGRPVPPDLLPAARALRGQTVKGFQHLIANPGTRRRMMVSVTAMPMTNELGEVVGSTSALVEVDSLSRPDGDLPALGDDDARRYFDLAGVMLLGLDAQGVIRDANLRASEVLGLPVEDVIGRNWHDTFVPERDREAARARFAALMAAPDGRWSGENLVLRADGQERLIAWRDAVVRDGEGNASAVLASGEDVTEARAAETGLQLAQDAGRVGVWWWDLRENRLHDTPQVRRLYGLPEDAPSSIEEQAALIHPDDRARSEAAFQAAWEGRAPIYETQYRVLRPDGVERKLAVRAEVLRDEAGEASGMRGVLFDVTDLETARAEAAESEARFHSFAEHSDEVFWLYDAESGALEYVSDAFERLYGAPASTLGADLHAWRAWVEPEDLPAVEAASQAVRRGERVVVEFRIRRPSDGELVYIEDTAFPVRDAEGRTRWIGGLARDVSRRRRAEEALNRHREELERRVAERTAELEASLEERRKTEAALAQAQRLETVGRLTGGVAHDFNNLLTVIIGALDMILRQSDRPERVRRLSEAALAAGRRGEKLTRQLLAFSRRQEFKLETLDLGVVIRGFEPLIRRAVGEETPFTVEVDPKLGSAVIDPVQFEAALLNLVVNAKDAIGPNGSIEVRAEPVTLNEGDLADVPAGDYARIAVIDDGEGMPADVAARAFEPFFTTKEVGKGTGLGLAQVYGFARQSGGGVRIDSEPGRGSAVAVFVPLCAPADPVAEERPQALDAPTEQGLSVLLVEDDLGVRTVVENLLLEAGCAVTVAEDGPSALEVLRERPDVRLLLTDVVMPGGLSGVELADRALELRPDLKILLSTGYGGERLAGAEGRDWPMLRKPYQAEELVQAVRRALA